MTGPRPTVPGLTGLTVLARGGYATVYRAVQESVGREVAVKVENRTLASERDRRRFLREARASGSMSSHPHVVDLFDAGVGADGHPYLIMELCDGSYADRIKHMPLTLPEACDVGSKIADALADAHSLGVLHRDVKPANILVSRFGEPALADFGLAILAETRDLSITLDVLTPAYAPPEMFRHAPPAPSGDVYALCATLFALVQGRPPRWRAGTTPNLVSLVDLFAEPVPEVPGAPPGFMRLLRAGMENDPSARPSAADLRDGLMELLAVRQPSVLGTPPGQYGPAAPSGPRLDGWAGDTGTVEIRLHQPAPADESTVPHQRVPAGRGGDRDGAGLAAGGRGGAPAPGPAGGRPQGTRGAPGWLRRRRWLLWVVAGATEAAVVLASVLVWSAIGHPSGDPAGHPDGSPVASAGQPLGLDTAPGGGGERCPVGFSTQARCPAEPECFDRLTVTGGTAKAKRLSCAARHTWETFAIADLADASSAADYRVVSADPRVKALCNTGTLTMVAGIAAVDWRIDVLPPTADAVRSGDLSFRCLAGKADNGLVGPQLGATP